MFGNFGKKAIYEEEESSSDENQSSLRQLVTTQPFDENPLLKNKGAFAIRKEDVQVTLDGEVFFDMSRYFGKKAPNYSMPVEVETEALISLYKIYQHHDIFNSILDKFIKEKGLNEEVERRAKILAEGMKQEFLDAINKKENKPTNLETDDFKVTLEASKKSK